MSAFIVDEMHIQALLTAGIALMEDPRGPLRWLIPEAPSPDDHERGSPWGPTAVENYKRRRRELTQETADAVGSMLQAANVRSVNYRYSESINELPGIFRFEMLPGSPNPVAVLKAIDCYAYQACEVPDWRDSEARAFCEALKDAAICRLPGYQEAEVWDITDRNVFQTHQSRKGQSE